MRDKNINEDLQNRILNYIKFQLKQDKERDKNTEQDLINILPPQVKAELFYEVNAFFFKNFEWSNRFSEQFITALSYDIEEMRLTEDITLYEPSYVENEDDINLYYLASGQIEIKKDLPQYNKGQGIQLNVIKENSFIGLYSFVAGTLIKEILKCKTPVKIFIIKRHKFLETIQNFPEDLKLWNIYKNKIINLRQYEEFELQCYNCLTHHHIIEECSLMSRKQTMLDKRERKIFNGTQQKIFKINDEVNEDQQYFNRKESDDSQISSSQLHIEQINNQKIQEESQINDEKEESQTIQQNEKEIDIQIKQSQMSKQPIVKEEELKNNNEISENNQKMNIKNQKSSKSAHITDFEYDLNNTKQSHILNTTKSYQHSDSFMHLQELNIDDHIRHQVYQETEQDKWEQRARIKERIEKKQSFQQKRSAIGTHSTNADDILLQIILSIQSILQQNNMDMNSLQAQTQGLQLKILRAQSQQNIPNNFNNSINKK